jgi:N-sulfoglucosamine sulfohydrolase
MVFMNDKKPLLVSPNDVEVPPYLPDNLIIRTDIARFLTNVQTMDNQVGAIIQKLKDDGLYDNTIIFFYSDHGDGLPFVKRELYDRGLKVPMIIRYPNAEKAKTIDNQLISFVDLAPTILSLTNIPIPKYMQGQAFLGNQKAKSQRKYIYAARDRMDSEYDRVRAVSDGRYKYLKNYMPEMPYYQNVIYRLQQKSMTEIIRLRDEGKLNEQQMYWFRTKKPNEELFDVKNDPFEFHNLANDPKYKAKLVELRTKHQDWLKNYGDLGAIPENEMVNKWWNGAEKAPKTVEPQIKINKNSLKLNSSTTGASIGYKNHWADKSWKVYSGEIPISKGDSVYAIAQRIGFTKSEIAKFKY